MVDKTKHAGDDLQYGDIVIIKHPDSNTQLVKRIVGKAGDTIEIRDSILYINGEAQRESYIYPEPFNDMNPVLVEDSSIFVMGDNRNYSSDSRKIGSISDENIVGNAICVIYPFNRIRTF